MPRLDARLQERDLLESRPQRAVLQGLIEEINVLRQLLLQPPLTRAQFFARCRARLRQEPP